MSTGEHRMRTELSTITGFAELTLETRDPEALLAFYVQGFGLLELSRESDRIWLAAGESARLGLWKPGEKECEDEGGAHVRFAFTVKPGGLDAIARRLRAQGVEIEGPVEHDSGDRSLSAHDPEGNVVEAWDLLDRGRSLRSSRDMAA